MFNSGAFIFIPLRCYLSNLMFAIIDIETCGAWGKYTKGRIIEICIVLHDGLVVEEVYSTLINPECSISPFYTNISGITNEMVANAPKFYEVAKKILELTEGRIFVAHNVGFDYGFVKEEFAMLGYKYKREQLCTVKLSRKLLPGRISYSLGNLCQSLGIFIEDRHRAQGDAEATAKLFDLILQAKSAHPQYRSTSLEDMMTRRIDKMKQWILDKIPEECGVYYFKDKQGEIIYIGKSVNMYNRALGHFNNPERKSKKMLNDLYNVDHVTTGSELVALLLESEEIKKHKPKYNRVRKSEEFSHSITWHRDKKGIVNFSIVPYDEAENVLLSFNTYLTARERLDSWIDKHELCLRYCGLTNEGSSCFNHQLKKCNGICAGHEDVEFYNIRAEKILAQHLFKEKNFAIIDRGRSYEESAVVLIENGHYAGYGYYDSATQISSPDELKSLVKRGNYYPDADMLVRGYMVQKNVKTVSLSNNYGFNRSNSHFLH